MGFDEIMDDITSGLAGDPDADVPFLLGVIERYKDHEYGKEITRAVARMIYMILPQDQKEELDEIAEKHHAESANVINEAAGLVEQGDLDRAEEVLRAALPDEEMYREDRNSMFMEFRQDLEEAYFHFKFEPEKDVRRATGVNPEIFFLLAYLLVEKEKLDEALSVLDRGLRFNPLHTKLLFEKAEIFKLRKDWKRFKETVDLCWEYSHGADDLAQAYRDYGYMLIEKKKFDAAVCCYLISLNFAETDMAQDQVLYISGMTGTVINLNETLERMEELLAPLDIPCYPNPEMVRIAKILAQRFEKEKSFGQALACHQVVFELTGDEGAVKKIEALKKKQKSNG